MDSRRGWRSRGRMKRRKWGSGRGHLFWGYVLDMRQHLQEHTAQGLFDVEIGQFESVSFNFSQLTGPPWVPCTPLIGYKLVFFVLSLPQFLNPSLFLLHITQVPLLVLFSTFFLAEWSCSFTPDVCQTVSHQHKTSLMLPLRHLLYSERDVLSAARLVFKTNKQNNGTTDLSSQFRHHICVVVISVCFTFSVKVKWKEPTEIHPDKYNTLPFQLRFLPPPPFWEVLCELKQSYWVHTDVSLVCSSVFISLSISQIASCRPAQLCFFSTLRICRYPNRLMCPSRLCAAGSDVQRVCLYVDVSTLIQTPLFSSHLSAPVVALGVKMDLCSPKKVESNTFFCL